MPDPWEEVKYVKVVYHKEACLTMIKDSPKVIE